MGVGKALRSAEQEQRRAQPAQHREPIRHGPGEQKEIVDVIQHHQPQGDGFEGGLGQALPAQSVLIHSVFSFGLLLAPVYHPNQRNL